MPIDSDLQFTLRLATWGCFKKIFEETRQLLEQVIGICIACKKNVPARRLERFCRALRACEIVGRLPRRGAMLALGAGRGDVIIIYNI